MATVRSLLAQFGLALVLGAGTSALAMGVITRTEVWNAYVEMREKNTPEARAAWEWECGMGNYLYQAKLAGLFTAAWFVVLVAARLAARTERNRF